MSGGASSRFVSWAALACCGLCAVALMRAQAGPPTPPRVVRAQAVELVGQDGRVYGTFSAQPAHGASLTMNDAQGRIRVLISGGDLSFINLYGDNGEAQVKLSLSEDGRPAIHLEDKRGQTRAWVGLSDDGTPHLSMFDSKRGRPVDLDLDQDECPALLLRGPGNASARFSVDKYGDCGVHLDPTGHGKPCAILSSSPSGWGSADVQGADGKSQAQIWVGPDKSGHLVVTDSHGKPVSVGKP